MGNRREILDRIHERAHYLEEVAKRYKNLWCLAEKEETTDVFIEMVDAIGVMTVEQLKTVGMTLDILWRAMKK